MGTLDYVVTRAYRRVKNCRYIHCLIEFACIVLSGITFTSLSYMEYELAGNCLLFADWSPLKPELMRINNDTAGVEPIRLANVRWGARKDCHFVAYSFASAAIAALILFWFFMLFKPKKKSFQRKQASQSSKLVLPGILITAIFCIVLLAASVSLLKGRSYFCSHVLAMNIAQIVKRCRDIQKFTFRSVKLNLDYLAVAEISAWLAVLLWSTNLVVLVARWLLHVDFPDYYFDESPTLEEPVIGDATQRQAAVCAAMSNCGPLRFDQIVVSPHAPYPASCSNNGFTEIMEEDRLAVQTCLRKSVADYGSVAPARVMVVSSL